MQDEIWRVQLPTGELRAMTIDELDAAFDAGVVGAETPVLGPSASAWSTLGVAAGLVAEPSAPVPSLAPFAIDATPSPTAVHVGPSPSSLDELDDLALRPKRGRVAIVAGAFAGLAAVVALALVLGRVGGAVGGQAAAAIEVGGATNAVEAPPAAEDLPTDPAKPKAALDEDQKKKLLEADKAREERARAKREKAAPKRSPRSKKGGSPFVNGGDKFDPLNGAL